ncbi:hypothetical protein EON81_01365 [bacterium]|nr:MAG: hypothetical protein EON81_01365 [bacterium]
MSILDKIFGREEEKAPAGAYADRPPVQRPVRSADEEAVERYQYMLRTAPPDQLERAHEEAFAKLTPEQRRLALQKLSSEVPDYERPESDDPRDLARAATRAEVRQPGTLNRAFGGGGMGMGGVGMGTMMVGGLMTSMAGAFIGSAIANQFFSNPSHENDFQNDSAGSAAPADESIANNDPAGDPANETASNEDPMGDPGADAGYESGFDAGGDAGGDFGGDF